MPETPSCSRRSSCATSPSRSARSSPCAPAAWSSQPGSIHALVGENGAGKSTLVKIVAGVHRRDAGDLPVPRRGRRLRLDRRVQGRRHRGDLPGADALPRPLGHREHLHGPPAAAAAARRIDRAAMYAEAERLFSPARRRTSTRAVRRAASPSPTSRSSRSPRPSRSTPALLIMDEPTAALSRRRGRAALRGRPRLRDEGRALVFISHRFDEVFALCDTVTVMRDGDYVSTDAIDDTSVDRDRRPDGRPRGRRALPEDAAPRSATSSSTSRA